VRTLAQLASWLALAASIVPALLFYVDRMTLRQVKLWMLVATVIWFVATPLWMERKPD
jgi:hypothetical protein